MTDVNDPEIPGDVTVVMAICHSDTNQIHLYGAPGIGCMPLQLGITLSSKGTTAEAAILAWSIDQKGVWGELTASNMSTNRGPMYYLYRTEDNQEVPA